MTQPQPQSPPQNRPSASFAPWMAAIFLAALTVYIFTVPPEFLFDDNPEFISSSHVLGVCHPPGYPLFSLFGKLFSNLTPSAVPYGVNFLSALAAALGVALFARALWKLTNRAPVAIVFAIFFMLSRTFWSQAAEAEVYATNILFTAALFNICLEIDSRWDFRLPALAAGLAGLAILNHYTALLIIPVVAIYIIFTHRNKIPPAAFTAALAAVLVLISLSALMYLPLRSAASPSVNWGDTHTAAGFFRHIKGVETMGKASRVVAAEKLKFIIDYLQLAIRQAPWPCFLLLIPGVFALYKRKGQGSLIAALFAATVLGFLFTLNYLFGPRASYVVSFFYITSFFSMFIIIGLGAAELLSLIPPGGKSPALEKGILLIPATLICLGAAGSIRFVAQWENRIAPNYGRNILRTLERDSAIFSFDITESFPLMALRSLYGMRPDTLLYGKPGDVRGGAASKGDRKESVADARSGGGQIALLESTGASHRVYLTIGAIINQPAVYPVVDGLLYRVQFTELRQAPPDKWHLYDMAGLSMDEPNCAGGKYDYLTCYVVSKYFLLQAADKLQRKEEGAAGKLLKKIVKFNPRSQFLRLSLATLYLHTGRMEDALSEYEAAAKLPPEEVESSLTGLSIYNNAGELYRYKKEWNRAIQAFEKARDISPDDYFTRFQLGRAHNEYAEWLVDNGQQDEASDECKSSIIELEKAAALGAGSDSLYTGLAWCSEQLGDDVKASKYYHKAVSEGDAAKKGQTQQPYSQNYYKAGEFYSSKLRKFPEAAAVLEKFLVKTPAAPESDVVRIKLAFIYCELKEYDKALAHLTNAVENMDKLTPYQQTAIYYYGSKAYLATGQKEKALLMMINGISKETGLPEMHRDFAKYLYSWGAAPAKEAVSLDKVTASTAASPEGKNEKSVVNLHKFLLNLLDNKARYAIALDEFQKYLDKVPGAWDAADIEKMMKELQDNFAPPAGAKQK